MLAQVENLINKKLIIVSGVATILCGMFNMFIFVDYFANNANGNMYLDTLMLATPQELIDTASNYGEAGRSLYVLSALTLDILTPLVASVFLTSICIVLAKKAKLSIKFKSLVVIIGMFACISDWFENLLMILLIKLNTSNPIFFATLARIVTSFKLFSMLTITCFIIYAFYKAKIHRLQVASNKIY